MEYKYEGVADIGKEAYDTAVDTGSRAKSKIEGEIGKITGSRQDEDPTSQYIKGKIKSAVSVQPLTYDAVKHCFTRGGEPWYATAQERKEAENLRGLLQLKVNYDDMIER